MKHEDECTHDRAEVIYLSFGVNIPLIRFCPDCGYRSEIEAEEQKEKSLYEDTEIKSEEGIVLMTETVCASRER